MKHREGLQITWFMQGYPSGYKLSSFVLFNQLKFNYEYFIICRRQTAFAEKEWTLAYNSE